MKTSKTGGYDVIVKVSPSEVKRLRDDEVIIVSRAQLNAQLVFASLDTTNEESLKNVRIIRTAIRDMMEQEKKQKSIAMGASMKVKDVKQIFSKIDSMPLNSFAQVKL